MYLSLGRANWSFRTLHLPFKDQKNIEKTLKFELETMLPYSMEGRVVNFFHHYDGTSSSVLCSIAPREEILEILNAFRSVGLDPDLVDMDIFPLARCVTKDRGEEDFVLVHVGGAVSSVCLVEGGVPRFFRHLRGLGSGDQCISEQDWLELARDINSSIVGYKSSLSPSYVPKKGYIFGKDSKDIRAYAILEDSLGLSITHYNIVDSRVANPSALDGIPWDPSACLATALLGIDNRATFDLRREVLPKRGTLSPVLERFRSTMVLIGLLLILFGAKELASLSLLEQRHMGLQTQIMGIYKETFKELRPGEDPVAHASNQVTELKKKFKDVGLKVASVRAIDVINDILLNMPGNVQVQIQRLTIDTEAVQITGSADSYNTIDLIKNELQKLQFIQEVTITSAKVDKSGKNVNFELRLKRKG